MGSNIPSQGLYEAIGLKSDQMTIYSVKLYIFHKGAVQQTSSLYGMSLQKMK